MASKHDMKRAVKHLMDHHKGCPDHEHAHGAGERVRYSGGKPHHDREEMPGSPKEGRKLTRMEED